MEPAAGGELGSTNNDVVERKDEEGGVVIDVRTGDDSCPADWQRLAGACEEQLRYMERVRWIDWVHCSRQNSMYPWLFKARRTRQTLKEVLLSRPRLMFPHLGTCSVSSPKPISAPKNSLHKTSALNCFVPFVPAKHRIVTGQFCPNFLPLRILTPLQPPTL